MNQDRPSPPIDRRSALKALAAASLTLSGGVIGCRSSAPSAEPTPAVPPPPSEASWRVAARAGLRRGVDWLLAARGPSGVFGSTTYGFLKGGQSLTPFVLDALLDAPAAGVPVSSEVAGTALRGLLDLVDGQGRLGFAGPAPDYPVYATGLALSCLGRLRPAGWEQASAPLLGWLRTQQFTGTGGWRAHTALGGFPMGWTEPPTPPHAGHVDLSMTRRALQGLRAVGVEPGDKAHRLAFRFVMRCRGTDGGFVYSPVDTALNKGGRYAQGSLSYGSATCDGVMALAAVSPGDLADSAQWPAAMKNAMGWLHQNHRVDVNPGVLGGPMEPFAAAMRGYYRAASSRVFAAHGGPTGWREALSTAALAEQHADGRWQSEVNLQKEDDPLVATAFAVRALSRSLA